ncbi:MAG TPA: DUF86 domain-containing protein [Candidatus Paceibacterota bacterium]
MKDDSAYLRLMLDAFDKLCAFTAGMDEAAFLLDQKTQSAVIMQLEVVGQLAKKVSDETRTKVEVPWRKMAGMRDWAAHDYFSLELPLVWETAMMEAPKAEKIIRDYVEQTFPPFPGTTP